MLPCVALGADARGGGGPPVDGDVLQPVTDWRAPPAAGEISAGLVGELGLGAVVRRYVDGETVEREVVLDRVVAVTLGVAAGLHERIGLGVTAPLILGAAGTAGGGPAPGDIRVQVPVALLLRGRHGLAISTTPFVTFPTGAEARFLGEDRVTGGIRASASYRAGPIEVGGHVGAGSRPDLHGGASLGWAPVSSLGFTAEAAWRVPVDGERVVGEAIVSGRGRVGRGWWTAGVGRAIASGVGAPQWRFHVGGGVAFGLARTPAPDEQGAPGDPAIAWTLTVVDPAGDPVPGAAVTLGNAALVADHLGRVTRERLPRGRLVVEARGMVSASFHRAPREDLTVALQWASVPVRVRVSDRTGRPVDAVVRLEGPSEAPSPSVWGASGTTQWELPAGDWRLTIDAPELGGQERELAILPGRTDAVEVDAVLSPVEADAELTLTVTDPSGVPVEGAQVLVRGAPVGTTGPGGTLKLKGLRAGETDVRVDAPDHGNSGAVVVDVGSEATQTVTLDWLPGSVRIVARRPDGVVRDALVRLSGPENLPAARLGEDGERLFVLGAGTWRVLVSSPAFGSQEREFEVAAVPGVVQRVEVVLQPDEAGPADLLVSVVDLDGRPLSGVGVSVDGAPVGTTSTEGNALVAGLKTGPRVVAVGGERIRDASRQVTLVDGLGRVDVVARWRPGWVEVSARDDRGVPVDALVRMRGPAEVAATALGADGTELFRLSPGTWEVLLSNPDLGLQARDLEVPQDGDRVQRVQATLQRPELAGAELSVVVIGPDGAPLPGAEVVVDGRSLGTTASEGSLRAVGVPTGARNLAVRAVPYAEHTQDLPVDAPTTTARVQLGWSESATRIEVAGPFGAVSDAILRIDGPRPVAAVPVDGAGTALLDMGPGEWSILASSASLGLVERQVRIEATPTLPHRVPIAYTSVGADEAVLLVRVLDERRRPVAGARVLLAGTDIGTTSVSGTLLAPGLRPGVVSVRVEPEPPLLPTSVDVDLAAGSQERSVSLRWARARALVTVVADGAPVDATVRFVGTLLDESYPAPKGTVQADLPPGSWRVIASADGFASARQEVVVEPGVDAELRFDLAPGRARIDDAGHIRVDTRIPFALDDPDLSSEAAALLDEVANLILSDGAVFRVEVHGHTDDSGGWDYNMELSRQRADAVRAGLVARGVAGAQVVVRAFGKSRPKADNRTEEGRAENRRVEFVIVER